MPQRSPPPEHAPESHSRRAFLKRSGQLAITGTALPFALNLAAIGEAAAFNSTAGDYKALVCVFLYGGNDYANTVVTYDDASYDQYSSIRGGGANRTAGGIAHAKAALAATLLVPTTAPLDSLGVPRQYALHPSMTGLAGLFNTGKAAVQLNVGPLVKPLTRAQYNSSDRVTNPRPPQLFSHNDQQSIWQSSSPEGSTVGWGGNIGDLVVNSLNGSAPPSSVFTCMSVAGNAVFLSGDTALQYQVSTSGAIKINAAAGTSGYVTTDVKNAMSTLIQQQRPAHTLENEYNTVTRRAMTAESKVRDALAPSSKTSNPVGVSPLATVFPTDSLGQQLEMVARLIKGRATLGVRRQVFFVSLGGFDLHDNLLTQQALLLGRVSAAMTAFYNATFEMGLQDQVTSFTASDFGRTLASNGDGSDHGWGNHHIVVGGSGGTTGAVKGAAFYGTPPPVSVGDTKDGSGNYAAQDQWHVGQGRLLPSTSVDQYAATLAKWFGVADAELPGILPNITRFGVAGYPTDLGFMR
jgi:uncharacterized protein (DUF1501 family)